MSIQVKSIIGKDTIASSRTTINENFTALANAIDTVSTIVDTDTNTLQSIKSLTLVDGTTNTPNPNSINLKTNASAVIDGHLTVGNTIKATSAELSKASGVALKINAGDVNLLSAESTIKNYGGIENQGKFVNTGLSSTFTANALASYSGGEGGVNYYEVDGSETIGHISATKSSAILMDFSGWDGGNATKNVRRVKLLTTNIQNGHTLKLIFILNTSLEGYNGVFIESTNVTIPGALSTAYIKIAKTYQTADFIFYNGSWIYLNPTGTTYNPVII